MKRSRIALAATIPILICLTLRSQPLLFGADSPSQLRVFIIAVQDFDKVPKEDSLYDPDIAKSITAAASDLSKFFSTNYQVTPVLITTHDDTSIKEVKTKLDAYFSEETQYSINLVFILTHGFGKWLPADTPHNSRLYLATSDSNKKNYKGVSLIPGDLMEYFESLRRGSTVFLFIDSCEAGAVNDPALKERLERDWKSSTRMMIISSSRANQLSYDARFTEALLYLWKQKADDGTPPCTRGQDDIAALITDTMNTKIKPPLAASLEQNVSVFFPYTENFCLESFGDAWGLLLLFNSASVSTDVTIRSIDGAKVFHEVMDPLQVYPKRLPRGEYRLIAHRLSSDSTEPGRPIDLAHPGFVQYVEVGAAKASPTAQNAGRDQAIELASELGATSSQIEHLREEQVASLRNSKDAIESQSKQSTEEVSLRQNKLSQLDKALPLAQDDETKARLKASAVQAELQTLTSSISALPEGAELSQSQERVQKSRKALSAAMDELQFAQQKTGQLLEEKRRDELALAEAEVVNQRATNQLSIVDTLLESTEQQRAVTQQLEQQFALVRGRLKNKLQAQVPFPVQENERGIVMRLEDVGVAGVPEQRISFLPVAAFSSSSGPTQLASVGAILAEYQNLVLEVEAYSEDGDILRSEQRAKSVAADLRAFVPSAKIHARGYGKAIVFVDGVEKIIDTHLQIVISGPPLGVPFDPIAGLEQSQHIALAKQQLQQSAMPLTDQTNPESEKIRIYVLGTGQAPIAAEGSSSARLDAGDVSGEVQPQTAEIIKTFNERCPEYTISDKKDGANYIVLLEHEGNKAPLTHRNKIAVFNQKGDVVFSESTRELGNSVGDACVAIRSLRPPPQ